MQLKQIRVLFIILSGLAVSGLLIFLLGVRLELSLVRYFDADEMAYLHWAHNVYSGLLPYRDFLQYVPPGFLYILAPVYVFFEGTSVLMAGRIAAFCIFMAMTGLLFAIFWRARHSKMAVWAAIMLLFLPVPADKLLEIRPDTLATALALLGLYWHIEALRGTKGYVRWTMAGFWYGVSLLILPKTLPQIAVAGLVSVLWCVWGDGTRGYKVRALVQLAAGMGIPAGIFAVWIGVTARSWIVVMTAVYSLAKLPFEVNRIGEVFGMAPDLFFYPNATYYGQPGWSAGLLANHVVWFIGLMTGCFRLVTPFLPGGRKGVFTELLIAGSLLAQVAVFIYGYPLRHAQYLIPIAVFVSFYAADALFIVRHTLSRLRGGAVIIYAGTLMLIFGMWNSTVSVNTPKFALTNREDIGILERALRTIPKNAYVLDLVGSTLYYKDPYYVCCVPFGQWEPYLSRTLPDLASALEKTGTQYVYQGRLERVNTLSLRDKTYIRTHFSPLAGDSSFLVRNK